MSEIKFHPILAKEQAIQVNRWIESAELDFHKLVVKARENKFKVECQKKIGDETRVLEFKSYDELMAFSIPFGRPFFATNPNRSALRGEFF